MLNQLVLTRYWLRIAAPNLFVPLGTHTILQLPFLTLLTRKLQQKFNIIFFLAFFYANDYWSMVVVTAVIGFLKTWLLIPVGLIFTEYLPPERYVTLRLQNANNYDFHL